MANHEGEPLTHAATAGPAQALATGAAPSLGAPHRAFGADPAAQLRWAQKIEAIGRLTGRVVHEINNQVTLMLGRTTLMLQRGQGPPAVRAEVEELHRSAERVARLMRQWLTLGRKDAPASGRLDLNALLAELVGMLDVGLGRDIELVTDFAADPAWVLADRGHLEQVILNLVLNARDAMAGTGTLTLRTASVELVGPAGDYLMPFAPGPHVLLLVHDTGSGMDRDTLAHIFEPYFTTKGPGKGSGMGLHHVWEIVREGGGTLRVTSEPGQGTAFAVYLPQAREGAEARAAPARSAPRPARETILVVEDEESVRALVREVLTRQGYTVLEASDGRSAIELAGRHDGPIHLLVTDCVLPHVNGGELARRLTGRYPALKVLHISGYPPTESALPGDVARDAPFLQKPFTPAALTSTVRELLGVRR
jgi:CheY-like chemotaxis protein